MSILFHCLWKQKDTNGNCDFLFRMFYRKSCQLWFSMISLKRNLYVYFVLCFYSCFFFVMCWCFYYCCFFMLIFDVLFSDHIISINFQWIHWRLTNVSKVLSMGQKFGDIPKIWVISQKFGPFTILQKLGHPI